MARGTPSPTDKGVVRRQAARLVQLGVIRSCTADEHEDTYVVVTAGGDTAEVERRNMPAYLRGLAQGHYAALNPAR